MRRQDSGEIGPLDLVKPALPWSLRDIRLAVRRWLSAVGAAPRAVADLLVAVGEVCSNAVEHAYGLLAVPSRCTWSSNCRMWSPPSATPAVGARRAIQIEDAAHCLCVTAAMIFGSITAAPEPPS